MKIYVNTDMDINMDIVKCIYQRNNFRGSNGQFRVHLIPFREISISQILTFLPNKNNNFANVAEFLGVEI